MQSIVDRGSDSEAPARLLVASVRDAEELAALAAEGCNTFTVSPEVAQPEAVHIRDKLVDQASLAAVAECGAVPPVARRLLVSARAEEHNA